MDVVFPLVEVALCPQPEDCSEHPKHRFANPKAIAAQTFKSNNVAVEFHELRAWQVYADIFAKQCRVQENFELSFDQPPGTRWVAYPYAVNADATPCCVVWRETVPRRRFVRHVRFYRDLLSAEHDNLRISAAISDAQARQFYTSPSPSQRGQQS